MKKLVIYTDASVIGGCEDAEFSEGSLALWSQFKSGKYLMAISELVVRELEGAPQAVKDRLLEIPNEHKVMLPDTQDSIELAETYLKRGIIGPGSRADALHVALATTGGTDVLVSWNFKHIVNLGRIRHFQAVNLELGYPALEIRTPKEVLSYE